MHVLLYSFGCLVFPASLHFWLSDAIILPPDSLVKENRFSTHSACTKTASVSNNTQCQSADLPNKRWALFSSSGGLPLFVDTRRPWACSSLENKMSKSARPRVQVRNKSDSTRWTNSYNNLKVLYKEYLYVDDWTFNSKGFSILPSFYALHSLCHPLSDPPPLLICLHGNLQLIQSQLWQNHLWVLSKLLCHLNHPFCSQLLDTLHSVFAFLTCYMYFVILDNTTQEWTQGRG